MRLSPTGALILGIERNVRSAGTGFLAQSQVGLYLNPQVANTSSALETVDLGQITVRIDGTFDGMKPLPPSIRAGNHVVQAVGYGPRGERRTLSIGLIVEPWIDLNRGTRSPEGRLDRISTTGDTRGINPGVRLTPWIRYAGQTNFAQGRATIVVQSDGTFRWKRLINRSRNLVAYVSWTDVESNRVRWAKVR
jgi:hypothetical protein